MPSCPSLFWPQHRTPLLLVIAHVKLAPTASPLAPLVSPLTSVGARRGEVVVVSPIWPKLFRPQHFTPPVTLSEQE